MVRSASRRSPCRSHAPPACLASARRERRAARHQHLRPQAPGQHVRVVRGCAAAWRRNAIACLLTRDAVEHREPAPASSSVTPVLLSRLFQDPAERLPTTCSCVPAQLRLVPHPRRRTAPGAPRRSASTRPETFARGRVLTLEARCDRVPSSGRSRLGLRLEVEQELTRDRGNGPQVQPVTFSVSASGFRRVRAPGLDGPGEESICTGRPARPGRGQRPRGSAPAPRVAPGSPRRAGPRSSARCDPCRARAAASASSSPTGVPPGSRVTMTSMSWDSNFTPSPGESLRPFARTLRRPSKATNRPLVGGCWQLGTSPAGSCLPTMEPRGASPESAGRRAAPPPPRSSTRSASPKGRTSAHPLPSGCAHRWRRRSPGRS